MSVAKGRSPRAVEGVAVAGGFGGDAGRARARDGRANAHVGGEQDGGGTRCALCWAPANMPGCLPAGEVVRVEAHSPHVHFGVSR